MKVTPDPKPLFLWQGPNVAKSIIHRKITVITDGNSFLNLRSSELSSRDVM